MIDPNGKQGQLVIELIELFAPLKRIGANFDAVPEAERIKTRARYFHDRDVFLRNASQFMTEGEPGHNYSVEFCRRQYLIHRRDGDLIHGLAGMTDAAWFAGAGEQSEKALAIVASIPVTAGSVIGNEVSPFMAFTKLKAVCTTTSRRLVWQDRYFDFTVFFRFLLDVPEQVEVTLMTWPLSRFTGRKSDLIRFAAFVDASELIATQRGTSGYRWMTIDEDIHQRRLVADDRAYSLDDTASQTAASMSFHPMTGAGEVEAVRDLEGRLTRAAVMFGPAVPQHPQAKWELNPSGKLDLKVF